MTQQQDLLKGTLKGRKQRMTAQREIILRIFQESNGKLLSVDDVFMEIRKKRNQRTSKMTVKRAIDLLIELELLRAIESDGTIKYEYTIDKKESSNIIFLCENCKKSTSYKISEEELRNILPEELKKDTVDIKEIRLKVNGYCEECNKSIKQ